MEDFKKSFKVPFSYLYKEHPYKIEDIFRPLPSENMKIEKDIHLKELKKSFPKKIDKVYWYQEGQNDGDDWLAVGRMKYGNKGKVKYFYFQATCDYTGFDCRGEMNLYVSSKLKNIKMYAIPKKSKFFS